MTITKFTKPQTYDSDHKVKIYDKIYLFSIMQDGNYIMLLTFAYNIKELLLLRRKDVTSCKKDRPNY